MHVRAARAEQMERPVPASGTTTRPFERMSTTEVGKVLGISRQAVCYGELRALRKIVAALEADPELREMWEAMA